MSSACPATGEVWRSPTVTVPVSRGSSSLRQCARTKAASPSSRSVDDLVACWTVLGWADLDRLAGLEDRGRHVALGRRGGKALCGGGDWLVSAVDFVALGVDRDRLAG